MCLTKHFYKFCDSLQNIINDKDTISISNLAGFCMSYYPFIYKNSADMEWTYRQAVKLQIDRPRLKNMIPPT